MRLPHAHIGTVSKDIVIRRAVPADAEPIATVHVAAWRSAYANLLPAEYLAAMSIRRSTVQTRAALAAGHTALIAEVDNQVVGYATTGRPRTAGLADGEVETLYVLDDYRDRGIGRRLLRAAATQLEQAGCGSLYLWVLADNPSRWFYERLGGRPVRRSTTRVAGHSFGQMAYLWDPIGLLTAPQGSAIKT